MLYICLLCLDWFGDFRGVYLKIYQIVLLKYVQLTLCQLKFNKAVKNSTLRLHYKCFHIHHLNSSFHDLLIRFRIVTIILALQKQNKIRRVLLYGGYAAWKLQGKMLISSPPVCLHKFPVQFMTETHSG